MRWITDWHYEDSDWVGILDVLAAVAGNPQLAEKIHTTGWDPSTGRGKTFLQYMNEMGWTIDKVREAQRQIIALQINSAGGLWMLDYYITDDSVVISGRCASYSVKKQVQDALIPMTRTLRIINNLVVKPS